MIGGKEKIEDEKADKKDGEEKKSNADSGKIVNLMASESSSQSRSSNTIKANIAQAIPLGMHSPTVEV